MVYVLAYAEFSISNIVFLNITLLHQSFSFFRKFYTPVGGGFLYFAPTKRTYLWLQTFQT
jgi:hypothetical protein